MAEKNKSFWQKKEKNIFWLILILAAVLRLWNIFTFDVMGDHALYSFRALGWFDYLGGGQTTPVQWFDSVPGWAKLSFHDAPPLGMLMQKICFFVFGDNTFAARLPFVLAGVVLVLGVYLFLKQNKNRPIAWLGMLTMAISSYAVLSSINGLLEAAETVFIIFSWYFFFNYLKREKAIDLYWCALLVGSALLSKYLAIFLLPALASFILIYYRDWLRSKIKLKEFLLAGLVVLAVLLPVIVYNAMVFKTRGHFDAALSSMVGMHPQDFSTISGRSINFDPLANFLNLLYTFTLLDSLPFLLLVAASLLYLLAICINRRLFKPERLLEKFILLNCFFLVLMFTFISASTRWLSVFNPVFAAAVAIFVFDSWKFLSLKRIFWRWFFAVGLIIIGLIELLYCFNTNILLQPYGSPRYFYSDYRLYASGWNELEDYWLDNLLPSSPAVSAPDNLEEMNLSTADFRGRNLIFYDDSADWFRFTWYIQKYQMYYHFPFLPISFLFNNPNFIEQAQNYGVKNIYYVSAVSPKVLDSVVSQNEGLMQTIDKLRQNLAAVGAFKEEIKAPDGETTFIIYKIQ